LDALAPEHLAALGVIAVVAATAAMAARKHPGGWVVAFSKLLAITILAAYLVENVAAIEQGIWTPGRFLPLHLTDVVTILSAIALWTTRQLPFELTYFWALSASLLATLTPDLGQTFPDVFYVTYFATHGGAVVAAVFLAAGCRMVPRAGSVLRVFGYTVVVAAAAAIGTVVTDGNYMWLREKPDSESLLDVMGPWPIYIVAAGALGLVLFYALDTPFRRMRRSAAGRSRFAPSNV